MALLEGPWAAASGARKLVVAAQDRTVSKRLPHVPPGHSTEHPDDVAGCCVCVPPHLTPAADLLRPLGLRWPGVQRALSLPWRHGPAPVPGTASPGGSGAGDASGVGRHRWAQGGCREGVDCRKRTLKAPPWPPMLAEGAVTELLAEPPPPGASERALLQQAPPAPRDAAASFGGGDGGDGAALADYRVLHRQHSDWVTCLKHLPEVGLVSSSLDATLAVWDLERGLVASRVRLHRRGVRTFAHCPAYSLVASGGVERSVLLWQPKGSTSRPVGELAGHGAGGVSQLVVADGQSSQVVTLGATDGVVRLWDLRTHKCVQAIDGAGAVRCGGWGGRAAGGVWMRRGEKDRLLMQHADPPSRLRCCCRLGPEAAGGRQAQRHRLRRTSPPPCVVRCALQQHKGWRRFRTPLQCEHLPPLQCLPFPSFTCTCTCARCAAPQATSRRRGPTCQWRQSTPTTAAASSPPSTTRRSAWWVRRWGGATHTCRAGALMGWTQLRVTGSW